MSNYKRRFLTVLFCLIACACQGHVGIPGDPHATMCIQDGFSPDQENQILEAIGEWHDRTGGGIDPKVIHGSSPSCDVQIVPVAGDIDGEAIPDGSIRLGLTRGNGSAILLKTTVPDDLAEVYPQWFYTGAALHEIGHYFTGPEHSQNPEDVMYVYSTYDVWHLSKNDVGRFHE